MERQEDREREGWHKTFPLGIVALCVDAKNALLRSMALQLAAIVLRNGRRGAIGSFHSIFDRFDI